MLANSREKVFPVDELLILIFCNCMVWFWVIEDSKFRSLFQSSVTPTYVVRSGTSGLGRASRKPVLVGKGTTSHELEEQRIIRQLMARPPGVLPLGSGHSLSCGGPPLGNLFHWYSLVPQSPTGEGARSGWTVLGEFRVLLSGILTWESNSDLE